MTEQLEPTETPQNGLMYRSKYFYRMILGLSFFSVALYSFVVDELTITQLMQVFLLVNGIGLGIDGAMTVWKEVNK